MLCGLCRIDPSAVTDRTWVNIDIWARTSSSGRADAQSGVCGVNTDQCMSVRAPGQPSKSQSGITFQSFTVPAKFQWSKKWIWTRMKAGQLPVCIAIVWWPTKCVRPGIGTHLVHHSHMRITWTHISSANLKSCAGKAVEMNAVCAFLSFCKTTHFICGIFYIVHSPESRLRRPRMKRLCFFCSSLSQFVYWTRIFCMFLHQISVDREKKASKRGLRICWK